MGVTDVTMGVRMGPKAVGCGIGVIAVSVRGMGMLRLTCSEDIFAHNAYKFGHKTVQPEAAILNTALNSTLR
eukprot:12351360-Ditylum_brightwellii.AAC.1